jgi:hypothetical protein
VIQATAARSEGSPRRPVGAFEAVARQTLQRAAIPARAQQVDGGEDPHERAILTDDRQGADLAVDEQVEVIAWETWVLLSRAKGWVVLGPSMPAGRRRSRPETIPTSSPSSPSTGM